MCPGPNWWISSVHYVCIWIYSLHMDPIGANICTTIKKFLAYLALALFVAIRLVLRLMDIAHYKPGHQAYIQSSSAQTREGCLSLSSHLLWTGSLDFRGIRFEFRHPTVFGGSEGGWGAGSGRGQHFGAQPKSEIGQRQVRELWGVWRLGWCVWGGEEEEELPAIGAGPVPAVGRVRVPTPRVSTARMGMQLPGW